MFRFMSVVWVMQGLFLLVLSAVLLVAPETLPRLLDDCVLAPDGSALMCTHAASQGLVVPGGSPHRQRLEVDFILASVRLLVPLTLAMAIASLLGFMREDERVRRRMARIFAPTGVALVLLLLLGDRTAGRRSDIHQALLDVAAHERGLEPLLWDVLLLGGFGFLLFLVASNTALAFWPLPRPERPLSGSGATRPPQLWILWLLQGVTFTLFALRPLLHPLERAVLGEGPLLYEDVHDNLRWLSPPLLLNLSLFSFLGMRASREWGWRAFSRIYAVMYGSWLLIAFFVWRQGFNPSVLLYSVPMLALMLGNLSFWSQRSNWFAEEVGEGPDGWTFVDLFVGPFLLWKTLRTRRRALYTRGAAARGTLEVVDYSRVPSYGRSLAHDFFPPHQQFEAQVRFSSEGADDAGLAARGVALRLGAPEQGRFDLLLSTGAYSASENLVQFALGHVARGLGGWAERWLWHFRPRMREGVIAALRRAPTSYTQLCYHSQTVRFWVARDGTRHLVRYRLVPEAGDACAESGLELAPPGRSLALERGRTPDERRPTDYLQQELKQRLEGPHTCTMRLEAQFHCPEPGDNHHWFNPAADWRTDEHPWVCIGHLRLEKALSDEQAETLRFNPARGPPSLGIPTARGLLDYRSIADSEKRVHRSLQKTRKWMTETFGLPALDSQPYDSP